MMFTKKRIIIATCAILAVLACIYWSAYVESGKFLLMDRCKEEGGRWDFQTDTCVYGDDQDIRTLEKTEQPGKPEESKGASTGRE
jgi:hypothetical protein